MYVLKHQNLAYLPIPKNGSTTYTAFFKSMGWEDGHCEHLPASCTIFSHIQSPVIRHFKGTAEYIVQNNLEHLVDNADWIKVWHTAVMDLHSYPITWALGKEMCDRIFWLPLSDDYECNNRMLIEWLTSNSVDVTAPINTLYRSSKEKKEIYEKLMKCKNPSDGTLSYFYESDILLHCATLARYL